MWIAVTSLYGNVISVLCVHYDLVYIIIECEVYFLSSYTLKKLGNFSKYHITFFFGKKIQLFYHQLVHSSSTVKWGLLYFLISQLYMRILACTVTEFDISSLPPFCAFYITDNDLNYIPSFTLTQGCERKGRELYRLHPL